MMGLWDKVLVGEAVGTAFGQNFGQIQDGDARSRHELSLQRRSIYKSGSLVARAKMKSGMYCVFRTFELWVRVPSKHLRERVGRPMSGVFENVANMVRNYETVR